MTPDDEEDEAVEQDEFREDPDESDLKHGDEPALIECLHCGKMIHEDTEWCHHCGNYRSKEDSQSVPKWILIGALLGMLGILGGILAWLFR